MVRWVVGSILHGVNPLSYFSSSSDHDEFANEIPFGKPF